MLLGSSKKILSSFVVKLKKIPFEKPFQLLIFLYMLMFMRILQKCYKIVNFNYFMIIFLFILGLVIHYFTGKYKKRHITILINFLFLFCVTLLLSINFGISPVQVLSHIKAAFISIDYNISHSLNTSFDEFLLLLIIIPIITSAALSVYEKGLGTVIVITGAVLEGFLWYTGFEYILRQYIFPFILLSCFLFSISYYKKIINRAEKNRFRIIINKKNIIIYAFILSIVISIFSVILIRISGVKNISQMAADFKMRAVKNQEQIKKYAYNIGISGFNNDLKLGGPLVLNKDMAFKVKSSEPYYLRGYVKDFYDGFRWTKTNSDYTPIDDDNIFYNFYDIANYFNGKISEAEPLKNLSGMKEEQIEIFPEGIQTSTIFTPYYAFRADLKNSYAGYDRDFTFISFDNSFVKQPYKVSFYKSDAGIEDFSKALKIGLGINYSTGSNLTPAESRYYEENVKKLYGKYLQIPDNIPKEVYDLAQDITKDCKNSTEKVEKIKEYLSSHFTYSLNVSEVPKGQEFLSYFLFKEKKGYCTYFATAETMLCRIEGIPARYVEGFDMVDNRDSENLFVVTNDMAHAWTEVLLLPEANLWSEVDCVPNQQELIQNAKEINILTGAKTTGYNNVQSSGAKNKNDISAFQMRFSIGNILSKLHVLLPAVLLLVVILFTAFKLIHYNANRKKILNSQSNIPLYKYMKRRLSTVLKNQYFDIDDILWLTDVEDMETRENTIEITKAAYREFFGKKPAVKLNKHENYYLLEKYIKERQNIVQYVIHKYF